MGYSSLCDSIHRNPSYNHSSGRSGCRACKITPHHMCAVWTGERCAESFDVRGRNASSNYCIGYEGEIVGCVDEGDRSWCSSSSWNDNRAITIEVANSSTGGEWPISQKSWDSLVRLCADICRRHGFRLEYTGDSSGSLTEHQMYAATNCPGPYLHARMGELARQVNAILDGEEEEERVSIEAVKDGVYRLYNPYANRHHFTTSREEAESLVGVGWRYEGVKFRQGKGSQVYRLYNPYEDGGHVWSRDPTEVGTLVIARWDYEGAAWRAGTRRDLMRLYDPRSGDHMLALEDEASALEASGWTVEGILCKVD